MASANGQQDALPERLYRVSEVAAIFDVTPATVREWLKKGDLQGHGIKIGKGHYWRIPASAVIDLAQRRHGSESQYE